MTFKKDTAVTVSHPSLGAKLPGVVLLDDLKGDQPLLIKLDMPGGTNMCIQTPADGGGFVRLANVKNTKAANEPAAPLPVVAYMFADGSATRFADPEAASRARGVRPAIGAMKAFRNADGTFSGHEFVSFVGDPAPAASPIDRASDTSGVDLPPEAKAELNEFFRKLFGKGLD